jgi:molybdenum cofactor cytidylyltransferase/nicotine blue oxidoreductase
MGEPKADLRLDGVRLVDRAATLLGAAGCRVVVAVVRAGTKVDGARVVVNPDPERGMRSSLELGVAVAAAAGADSIAVVLVDTPGLTREGTAAVLDAWRPGRITVARYGSQRGHPTIMGADLWQRAVSLAGPDEGARGLLQAEPQLVDEVVATGSAVDLDTPDDLRSWTGRDERDGD